MTDFDYIVRDDEGTPLAAVTVTGIDVDGSEEITAAIREAVEQAEAEYRDYE